MLKAVNLSKKFEDFELKSLSFEIPTGSYAMIIGESGSGKTVLIELLSGLRKPDSGQVFWNDADIDKIKPQNRKFAVVFQDGNLFPHLTVEKNILFPLQAKKTPKSEYSPILKKAIEETGVGHLLHRFPAQISGGERQRVALARALVSEAELILLDEPLSAVDVERRDDLIYLLKKVNLAGKTIVHITHNVDETYRLASHVVILNNGLLLQHGDIETVTLKPQSPFVARLFGYLNFFSSDDLNTVVFLQSLGINSSKGEPLVIDPTRIKLALQNNNDLHSRSIEITEIIKTTNGFYVKLSTNPVLTAFIDNATFSANPFYLGNKVTICIR